MPKPKRSTALVVVDMQPGFHESCREPNISGRGDVLHATKILVRSAVRDGLPIIFLEYRGSGQTYRALKKLCEGYNRAITLQKDDNDGSHEVLRACKHLRIRPSHFVVCGVNYTACVFDTIHGLRRLRNRSKITLVKEATNFYESRYFTKMYEEDYGANLVNIFAQQES